MISRFLYRYVFKRTSSFVLSIIIASVFFERAYDHACENIFEWINEGRLWMNIKDRYKNLSVESTYYHNPVEGRTSDLQQSSDEDTEQG